MNTKRGTAFVSALGVAGLVALIPALGVDSAADRLVLVVFSHASGSTGGAAATWVDGDGRGLLGSVDLGVGGWPSGVVTSGTDALLELTSAGTSTPQCSTGIALDLLCRQPGRKAYQFENYNGRTWPAPVPGRALVSSIGRDGRGQSWLFPLGLGQKSDGQAVAYGGLRLAVPGPGADRLTIVASEAEDQLRVLRAADGTLVGTNGLAGFEPTALVAGRSQRRVYASLWSEAQGSHVACVDEGLRLTRWLSVDTRDCLLAAAQNADALYVLRRPEGQRAQMQLVAEDGAAVMESWDMPADLHAIPSAWASLSGGGIVLAYHDGRHERLAGGAVAVLREGGVVRRVDLGGLPTDAMCAMQLDRPAWEALSARLGGN